ncbi:hypothetical protein MASR1M31_19480 [Porphyromonadaceae bacterium]
MSLITCPECRKEVSDKAKTCPQCGYPIDENENTNDAKLRDDTPISEENSGVEAKTEERYKSFWSYSGAKVLLILVIFSLILSIVALIPRDQDETDLSLSVEFLRISVNSLNERLLLVNLGLSVSEGVVTDKVVISKATFSRQPTGEVTAVIDLRPQPLYSSKFLGHGNFDLTDRELRSMLEEIIDELYEFSGLEREKSSSSSNFYLKSITITANNYSVASYADGEITLSGE